MRKTILIFCISLAILFATGHYFIYKSVLKSHKKEFKSYIRSNYAHIETLTINPSELYADNEKIIWLDENKEVCMNGVMYDIIRIENNGVKVKLFAVRDKHEKDLMDRYREQFNDQFESNRSGEKNKNIVKQLLSFKFLIAECMEIVLTPDKREYHFNFQSELCYGYLCVPTLPPLNT